MKDKEMIEEMVKDCCDASFKNVGKCFIDNRPCISVEEEGKYLYNAGYLKIYKDSVVNTPTIQCETYSQNDMVVLSREEYEKLLKIKENCLEIIKQGEEQILTISKETAEKFLQLAYDRCLEKSFIKKVEELAKSLGVEIKE